MFKDLVKSACQKIKRLMVIVAVTIPAKVINTAGLIRLAIGCTKRNCRKNRNLLKEPDVKNYKVRAYGFPNECSVIMQTMLSLLSGVFIVVLCLAQEGHLMVAITAYGVDVLVNFVNSLDDDSYYACLLEKMTIPFEIFIRKNLNVQNSLGDTPLHCAIMRNDLNEIKSLIENNQVNLSLVNIEGFTPLKLAEIFTIQSPDLKASIENSIKNRRNFISRTIYENSPFPIDLSNLICEYISPQELDISTKQKISPLESVMVRQYEKSIAKNQELPPRNVSPRHLYEVKESTDLVPMSGALAQEQENSSSRLAWV